MSTGSQQFAEDAMHSMGTAELEQLWRDMRGEASEEVIDKIKENMADAAVEEGLCYWNDVGYIGGTVGGGAGLSLKIPASDLPLLDQNLVREYKAFADTQTDIKNNLKLTKITREENFFVFMRAFSSIISYVFLM